jgi:hypothetical protein
MQAEGKFKTNVQYKHMHVKERNIPKRQDNLEVVSAHTGQPPSQLPISASVSLFITDLTV